MTGLEQREDVELTSALIEKATGGSAHMRIGAAAQRRLWSYCWQSTCGALRIEGGLGTPEASRHL